MVQAREKQMLVTYLSPMLLGLEEPLCQELAERLRDGWNARRPKDTYSITTYARLQEGFRNVILGIDITGWQKRREEETLNRAPARKRKNLPGNGKNMKKLFDNRAAHPL